jgi:DNA-binding NarL/FixJ family response regulator
VSSLSLLVQADEAIVREAIASAIAADGRFKLLATFSKRDQLFQRLRTTPTDLALFAAPTPIDEVHDCIARAQKASKGTRIVMLCAECTPGRVRAITSVGVAAVLDKFVIRVGQLGDALAAAAGRESRSPAEDRRSNAGALSEREREVLGHVAAGADNLKIAALLGITERTVKAHVSAVYRKLGADNRVELAMAGLKLGAGSPRR